VRPRCHPGRRQTVAKPVGAYDVKVCGHHTTEREIDRKYLRSAGSVSMRRRRERRRHTERARPRSPSHWAPIDLGDPWRVLARIRRDEARAILAVDFSPTLSCRLAISTGMNVSTDPCPPLVRGEWPKSRRPGGLHCSISPSGRSRRSDPDVVYIAPGRAALPHTFAAVPGVFRSLESRPLQVFLHTGPSGPQ